MATDRLQKIPVVFYRNTVGRETVRDRLKGMVDTDCHTVGQDLMRAQWRWRIGMPLCRPIWQRLWKVRTEIPSNRIARAFLYLIEGVRGAKTPEGVEVMSKKRRGSSFNDLLKEEGIVEETQALAVKEVVVWQLAEAMGARAMTKTQLATALKTSRSQVDRLLDPRCDVTLSTLQRAAALMGRKVQIELV